MLAVWLLLLFVGLLLSVRVMAVGVMRPNPHAAAGDPSQRPHVAVPTFGVFCLVAGLLGYDGFRLGYPPAAWLVTSTIALAVVAALAARHFIIWTSTLPSTDPEDDPRYRYQGYVARVIESIPAQSEGRITFEADAEQFSLRATTVDGEPVDVGTEVVIDCITDQVAVVEVWARVEERL